MSKVNIILISLLVISFFFTKFGDIEAGRFTGGLREVYGRFSGGLREVYQFLWGSSRVLTKEDKDKGELTKLLA